MRVFSLLVTLGLAGSTLVRSILLTPESHGHVLHEKRDESARGLRKRERLGGNMVLPVRIGLKQSNLDKGVEWLMDV